MSKKIRQDISLGPNLRSLRIKAGYTQEQVSAKLQAKGCVISREIISQMERGEYHIRVSILLELQKLYRVQIQDFFEGLKIDDE